MQSVTLLFKKELNCDWPLVSMAMLLRQFHFLEFFHAVKSSFNREAVPRQNGLRFSSQTFGTSKNITGVEHEKNYCFIVYIT
jgi:hypothetical protein